MNKRRTDGLGLFWSLFCDEERAEPKGKALDWLICLRFNPYLWPWGMAHDQKNTILDRGQNELLSDDDRSEELHYPLFIIKAEKESEEVLPISDQDASWAPPFGNFPGISHWDENPGNTLKSLEGWCIFFGAGRNFGIPWNELKDLTWLRDI